MVLVAVDTETYEFDNKKKVWKPTLDGTKFVLGCIIIDGRKTPLFFYKAEEMYKFLVNLVKQKAKEGHNTFIYAHNHSYDLYAYAHEHLADTEIIDVKRTNPALFGFLGKKEEKKGIGFLLDTLSFHKGKLGNVGEILKLPKLSMPKKVEKISDLKPYLYRDTQIVMGFIKMIRDKLEILGHKPKKIITAGHIAINYFRQFCDNTFYDNGKKKLRYSSYLYKNGRIHKTKYPQLVRKAYRGARNESYKGIEDGIIRDVTIIDVNSLYPYVMAEKMRMPDLLTERMYKGAEFFFTQKEILEMIGIAEATIKQPVTRLGYLPCKNPNGKGIFFPRSTINKEQRIKGVWTIFELKRFVEEGGKIEKIHNIVVYKELPFNPFKEFMNKLYRLRKNSDEKFGFIVKLIMNNLHGKFAELRREKKRIICHRADCLKYEQQGYEIEVDYGEKYHMSKEGDVIIPKHTHPVISALTTAYARDEIYNHLKKIPFEDLLYCDTDSVCFKGNHLNKFKIGKELGEFKVEFEKVKALFIREKVYQIYNNKGEILKSVLAGSKNKVLTKEQIKGKEGISNKLMYGVNRAFRTGNFEKVGTFFEQVKKVNPYIRKRKLAFPPYFEEYSQEEMIKCEV